MKMLAPFLTIGLALLPAGSTAAQADAARPNILLIVGDDIGFGDLGVSGSVTLTPTLDTLAEEGTFFTNFHVSPACSVTRSMLLTRNDPIEIGLPPSTTPSIHPRGAHRVMKRT